MSTFNELAQQHFALEPGDQVLVVDMTHPRFSDVGTVVRMDYPLKYTVFVNFSNRVKGKSLSTYFWDDQLQLLI